MKETKIINAFPGYEFKQLEDGRYHNMYRGTDLGFGGYVYSEPGMYGDVALMDIQSQHPTSAVNLNAFGEYTPRFKELLDARIAIKHKDFNKAKKMLGGKLEKYLTDEDTAADLAQALKIAINSVYGLTSASFDNPFRDIRNKNNIIALRGALFMRTLQDEVAERGFIVASIRTDSIKIPDATPEIIQFVTEFGKKYGYNFEHEATYDRMCLVNDAVYIAKYATLEQCYELYGKKYVELSGDILKDCKKHPGEWTATGTQFAVPYVFKTLFSKEELTFKDMCETKEVKSALYLDMNENLPDVSEYEKQFSKAESNYKKGLLSDTTFEKTCAELRPEIEKGHDYHFIGKVGLFCPIKPGCGGGVLLRAQNNKYYAVSNSSGYRWLESEMVKELGKEEDIDRSYYDKLVDDAVESISQYGDFEWFVSDDPYVKELGANDADTCIPPCGEMKYATCFDCPNFHEDQFHTKCDSGYDISDVVMDSEDEYLPF